jgi:hypothetical protein
MVVRPGPGEATTHTSTHTHLHQLVAVALEVLLHGLVCAGTCAKKGEGRESARQATTASGEGGRNYQCACVQASQRSNATHLASRPASWPPTPQTPRMTPPPPSCRLPSPCPWLRCAISWSGRVVVCVACQIRGQNLFKGQVLLAHRPNLFKVGEVGRRGVLTCGADATTGTPGVRDRACGTHTQTRAVASNEGKVWGVVRWRCQPN